MKSDSERGLECLATLSRNMSIAGRVVLAHYRQRQTDRACGLLQPDPCGSILSSAHSGPGWDAASKNSHLSADRHRARHRAPD